MDTISSLPVSMIERLAHLLAESPLDDGLKKSILDNLDVIPEYLVVGLLDALEAERKELQILNTRLQHNAKHQAGLEVQQKDIAHKLVDRWSRKIADDYKLGQFKSNL